MKSNCDMCLRSVLGLFLIFVLGISDVLGETELLDEIIHDNTIIGPGLGSEGVLINEEIDSVLKRIGRNKFKISKPRNTGELFNNIFKIKSKKKIYFESIYYHNENKYAVCVFQGRVIAIIGFDNNRMTTDSINLRSGITSFIFYYGNRNLNLLKADSNRIYLYPDRGIAVADDGMNDSIDLYVIFAVDSINKK